MAEKKNIKRWIGISILMNSVKSQSEIIQGSDTQSSQKEKKKAVVLRNKILPKKDNKGISATKMVTFRWKVNL